jgi:hypothetical protein
MSVEHLAIVLHHSRAKGTAKLVLLGIANHSGDGGAWPSIATLARYANVDERTVQRAIRQLVTAGELAVEVQGGGLPDYDDYLRPNRFDLVVRCPESCDRSAQHRDARRSIQLQLPRWGRKRTAVEKAVDNGVTLASPGDTGVTPPGDTGVTLTTISNPTTPGPASVTDRARGDKRPCSVCRQGELVCRARARNTGDDHAYSPARSR